MAQIGSALLDITYVILGSGIGSFITQKIFEYRLEKKMFRFTKIYTDKIDIIKVFYSLLIRAEKALDLLMSRPEPKEIKDNEEYRKNTFDVISNFFDFYEENEIVFEPQIVILVEELQTKFNEAKKSHNYANMLEPSRGTEDWKEAIKQKIAAKEKLVIKEIPELKIKLKTEFQKRYQLLQK
jgi:sulfur relay (sulfurtransferase) DsrC/TusE family protein